MMVQPTLPSLLSFRRPEPFPESLRGKYAQDSFFKIVLDSPTNYKNFVVEDSLVFCREGEGQILCIPDIWIDGKQACEVVIKHAHSILAHLGAWKTLAYLRDQVWWRDMVKDIITYCDTCHTCKMSKPNNQHPYGLLQPLPIP